MPWIEQLHLALGDQPHDLGVVPVVGADEPAHQAAVREASVEDLAAQVGDEIGVKLDTSGFGRILAQTAKQVIIQRVRDAERDIVFDEYKDRKGEVLNGIVRRFEKGSIIVDLGRAEAILPAKEQVPRENYRPGDRIRAYVLDVNHASKGAQIILSRACIQMLTKLFAQEVPEIYEGIVTIESAAREPGGRSKIAVASRDGDVDPVGACVGMKGSRVQAVVQELRGERIDIVPWSPDPARYVCSALSPAQVSKVIIDEGENSMDVIVPDDQADNDISTDVIEVSDPSRLGTPTTRVYRAKLSGEIVALVLSPVVTQGYSGSIRLIVGVRQDGTLAGVRGGSTCGGAGSSTTGTCCCCSRTCCRSTRSGAARASP